MKIPILNIYYLLCYATQHVKEAGVVKASELNQLDQVQDLLSKILAEGTLQLVRRGLDRGYQEVHSDLPGIRGRIDISNTVKRALRARGRVACIFEEMSHDVLHNRILKSTLDSLSKLPKPKGEESKNIRKNVSRARQKLGGIPSIHLDRQAFGRVQLDRNRRAYRFLISICRLVHDRTLVDETTGEAHFREFDYEDTVMNKLFENFIIGFYTREQKRYSVNREGKKISWINPAGATDADFGKIPGMFADVLLDSGERRIILDAKFYKKAFQSSPWSSRQKLHSGNLYQMLAYLRNREQTGLPGPKHEGILLYPQVESPIRVDVQLEGFRIQARGINLHQEWAGIHKDMLDILEN